MQKDINFAGCAILVKLCLTIIALFFAVFFTASCNNNVADIPFPLKNGTYPQPVSKPLQLGAPKKLHLAQAGRGLLKTRTQPLNIASLPFTYYDSAGFKSLNVPINATRFSYDKLPSAGFKLQNLPSQSLHFKTEILALPITTKIASLVAKTNTTVSAFDMAELLGLKGKWFSPSLMMPKALFGLAQTTDFTGMMVNTCAGISQLPKMLLK